jgi:hypothetical protein
MENKLPIEAKAVELCVNRLRTGCGSHEKAAEYLGYSIRQYRDIRRKIRTGRFIAPHIEILIQSRTRELQMAGA